MFKRKIYAALLAFLLTWQVPVSVSAKVLLSYEHYAYSNPYPSPETDQPHTLDSPPRSEDWSPDLVSGIEIDRREEGLDMKGEIPDISDNFGSSAGRLNEMIDEAVANRIKSAKEARAKSISFGYDIYSDSDMISVIIKSTVTSATSKTEYDSINFDPSDGSGMDITDAAGFDIVPLAEKVLSEYIRRDPERYNVSFDASDISENPFYLEDETVVILFDDFQLSSAAKNDINELRLELDKVKRVRIRESQYRINKDFNLKMVPLERVCSGLGYDAEWNLEDQRAYIYFDGELVSDLEPGVNNYEEHGQRMRTLETAPEMHDETIYVPISFFDQILSWITYTMDGDDDITFYSYDE